MKPTGNRKEWPDWAQAHFPDTHLKAAGWEAMEWHYPLHRRVLVVAHTRIEGAWSAYCDVVPGWRHDQEHEEVLRHGDKVGEKVARVMFPFLDFLPYDG
jgi:hypothetical protein